MPDTPTTETRAIIEPILRETYGTSLMVSALAEHLAERIDRNDHDDRGRHHMVMCACWDWFPGGTTANATATRIVRALAEAGVTTEEDE
jgi:hypothetical protein